jgi:RNA polymerase sigma-70 factor (ECF subfamily)
MTELSVSNVTDVQKVTLEDGAPGGECDLDLIERCLSGSEEAFNRLVLRHQRRAVNLAYRFLGNYDDACDIAQEAFLRVYKSLRRFKKNCSFKTWLYKIVLNLSRNKYRWKKRRGEFGKVSIESSWGDDCQEPMEIADATFSVASQLRRKEIRRRIGESLRRLPRNYREILVLRHMEQMSYSDMSQLLRCAEGTIKSRLHRARIEIRKLLADVVES